jgi:phosphotriesterase-related protein
MATINSVLGPIDSSDLGFTLPHEHVLTSTAGFKNTYPELLDRELALKLAVNLLTEARGEGVRTIVDCTTHDLDRDVTLMEAASRGGDVQIICSTGCHLFVPHTFYPTMFRWMKPMTADAVADLWEREIEEGIEGTGIKAGIIKIATNDPISGPEELMLRAGARAHHRTGVLITTHTPESSRVGIDQIRILEEEGVDLGRVYVGHVNSTLDTDYHKRMIDKGVWLGMDHFYPGGPPGTPTWEERASFIKDLVMEGYQGRIMMSHDWNVGHHVRDHEGVTPNPSPDGYLWITRSVLPRLRELGVSEGAVTEMTVDNPRRFFEGTGR